ncbi:hypothetical protein AAIB48_19395 [Paraclostridium benzoelyticum]|uniref:hypothetical protein n=1 Tax=Paraclostridium benzoelyticum TaxID=1629550 RepID=UPI0031CCEB17
MFKLKGVFIIGLVGVFPISLFIQGVVCSKKNGIYNPISYIIYDIFYYAYMGYDRL